MDKAIRRRGASVGWVIGMSAGKDTIGLLRELLQHDRDTLVAVPFGEVEAMPWVRPQDPTVIVEAALREIPGLRADVAEDVVMGLQKASQIAEGDATLVVCGSLYLVADFVRASLALAH